MRIIKFIVPTASELRKKWLGKEEIALRTMKTEYCLKRLKITKIDLSSTFPLPTMENEIGNFQVNGLQPKGLTKQL